MKIALIGATGQLGRDLAEELSEGTAEQDLVLLTEEEIDITREESVRRALESASPEVVVNSAAFTDVPGCETDPLRAFEVNSLGAFLVARTCSDLGAALLHVSTDYVFDGRKDIPYLEEDLPAPINIYGISKLAGEHLVEANCGHCWIVRTSGLYGAHPCIGKGGSNFVRTMLRLAEEGKEIAVVADERLSPTWTRELARQIREIMGTDWYGVIHAAAGGDCSWYEFAEEIFRLSGRNPRLRAVSADEYGAGEAGPRVRRPRYSVLRNDRLEAAEINRMRDWREGLRDYLEEIGELRE